MSFLYKPPDPLPDLLQTSREMRKTKLFDFHVKHGGKMVDFAGCMLPIQYDNMGILASHLWTRENASLFDVSHMLQTEWIGKDRVKFIESLIVSDVEALPFSASTLSVFTNETGGIIDDTVINKKTTSLYVVTNAACAEKDLLHINTHLKQWQDKGSDVDVKVIDKSLVALQGPKAVDALQKLSGKSFSGFTFMSAKQMDLDGIPVHISRCGYTGEDGFEISVDHSAVEKLCEKLLENPAIKCAGLGSRDSLRLEGGLCLYGHDLDENITPIEAGLTWIIGKRRRVEGGFLGANVIIPQIEGGIEKRRIGFTVQGAPAREGAEMYSLDGILIGKLIQVPIYGYQGRVTSGGPSPNLKLNIGMGYVRTGYHKTGTEIQIKVRNKMQKAQIAKMPFVPHQYYRGA